MRYVLSVLLGLTTLCAVLGSVGCGKNEEPSNPNLKVPDVPPSAHGSKNPPMKPGSKKK